jgi:transcriptional regulator with XRE-family HTH domain
VSGKDDKELTLFGAEFQRLIEEAGFKNRSEFLDESGLRNMTVYRWERVHSMPRRDVLAKAAEAFRRRGLEVTTESLYAIFDRSRAIANATPRETPRPREKELNPTQIRKLIDSANPSQQQRRCWGKWYAEHAEWNRVTRTFVRVFFSTVQRVLADGQAEEKAIVTAADEAAEAVTRVDAEAENFTRSSVFGSATKRSSRPRR